MEKATQSRYIPMVDFWKFIFSVAIMCYHATLLPLFDDVIFFKNGYIFVEFFFMVSGFFMAKSLYEIKDKPITRLADEDWRYTLKKAGSIYIPYLVAFVIHFGIRMLVEEMSIKKMLIEASMSIRELTFTYSSGIDFGRFHNGPAWYLSAMIMGIFIIYPFLRKHYDTFSKIIAPVFSIIVYAYLQRTYRSTNLSNHDGQYINLGLLRGVCGLCVGIFIFNLVNQAKNSKMKLNLIGKGAMIVTEFFVVVYLMLIAYDYRNKFFSNIYDYFSIVLQAALVFILFYDPVKINNKIYVGICKWLGKLSLYIYLNHRIWIRVFETATFDDDWGRKKLLVVYFILTGATVLISWLISFILERYKDKLLGLLKKIFIKKQTATK